MDRTRQVKNLNNIFYLTIRPASLKRAFAYVRVLSGGSFENAWLICSASAKFQGRGRALMTRCGQYAVENPVCGVQTRGPVPGRLWRGWGDFDLVVNSNRRKGPQRYPTGSVRKHVRTNIRRYYAIAVRINRNITYHNVENRQRGGDDRIAFLADGLVEPLTVPITNGSGFWVV